MPIAFMSMHSFVCLVGSKTCLLSPPMTLRCSHVLQRVIRRSIDFMKIKVGTTTVCLMNWIFFFCNGSNIMNLYGSIFRICGAGAGAGAVGAGTFCPEPEPSRRFTWSRSRSWSRNTFPETEPEPSKIFTAPHP